MLQGIMAIFILATIFAGIALIVGVFFWGIRSTRGGGGRITEQQNEETRLIQQIYQSLNTMESRVEALETILIEQQKKEDTREESLS
jgi:TolA-binding protein